ncbi:MAG: ABC transporter ATP-binding protein [Chloroflexota bacterium]
MLELVNITKTFATPSGPFTALQNINLTIQAGEFVSLVGPSGCGKTTLVKIVDGLIAQDSGEAFLNGAPSEERLRDMAFVFQDVNLLPWLSTSENVALGLRARGKSKQERRATALEVLSRVGLQDYADRPPYTLSGGMQQRVGLARALAVEPKLLLMDEPFGQVDSITRQSLQEGLGRLWNELRMMVLFVTHDIDEALFLSDKVVIMGSSPGRVREIIAVDLPRPRSQANVRTGEEGRRLYTQAMAALNDTRPPRSAEEVV